MKRVYNLCIYIYTVPALKSKGTTHHNVNVRTTIRPNDCLKVSDSTPCGVQQRKKSHLQSWNLDTGRRYEKWFSGGSHWWDRHERHIFQRRNPLLRFYRCNLSDIWNVQKCPWNAECVVLASLILYNFVALMLTDTEIFHFPSMSLQSNQPHRVFGNGSTIPFHHDTMTHWTRPIADPKVFIDDIVEDGTLDADSTESEDLLTLLSGNLIWCRCISYPKNSEFPTFKISCRKVE